MSLPQRIKRPTIPFGKKSGLGTFITASGVSYQGRYADDKLSGVAVASYPDGSRFFGTWKNDSKDGAGVLIKTDTTRELQAWKEETMGAASKQDARILSASIDWIFLALGSENGLASGTGDAVSMDGTYHIENFLPETGVTRDREWHGMRPQPHSALRRIDPAARFPLHEVCRAHLAERFLISIADHNVIDSRD